MRTFPVEIEDDALWDLFKATITSNMTTQETFQEFVRERVQETLDEEFIERSPGFDERHLEYFRSELLDETDAADNEG